MAKKFSAAEEFLSNPKKEEVDIDSYPVPKGYRLKPLPKNERMHCLVTTETRTALREIATRRGISVNKLINEIFEEYLKDNA